MFHPFVLIFCLGYLFVFISILSPNKKREILFFAILLILIVLADGLRWEMGVDWKSYKKMFDTGLMPGVEFGFRWYVQLISSFTSEYSIFIFITALLIYFGNLIILYKDTHSLLAVSFVLSILPWFSGSMRQFIATAFVSAALVALPKMNKKHFIFLILMGTIFHLSAFLLMPIIFMYGVSPIIIFIIFILCFPITVYLFNFLGSLGQMLDFLFASEKDFTHHLGNDQQVNPLLGTLRKFYSLTLPFFITVFSPQLLSNKKIVFYGGMSIFTFVIYFLGINYMQILSSRLDYYFSVLALSFLIGHVDKSITRRSNKIFLAVFVISLSIVSYTRMTEFSLFYPYSSIFYNEDLERELY